TENTEDTEIIIYNLKGQEIKTFPVILSPESSLGKGQFSIEWNGMDENNNPVSSGIYLYKLKSGIYTSTKKMILMK
ncbi:MAG: T9SS type A sorting domain-containing protein, partial [Candidatus Cloacimonetes bacterium]|nr:T9SS type A sorting domain-containing protein [Candidatus Cloacimonadota bacterium]